MGGFTNDFSFSLSQWRTFNQCKRRWYLEKIQSRKGWNRTAPPAARHAYRCKQMTGLFALGGRIVHEIAKEALVEGIELEAAEKAFETRMRRSWVEAKTEATKLFSDKPKHVTNLFELFYQGHDIDNVKGFAQAAFRRGAGCVRSIFGSTPYLEAIEGQIIEVEELRKVLVGMRTDTAAPVWLMIDLAYRDADGLIWLWDWKTGKPRDSDIEQILLYAVAALELMTDPDPEKLRLGIMYLKGESEVVLAPSVDQLREITERVETDAGKLRSLLNSPGAINEAPKSRFPRTDDLHTCRRCEMFFACRGHRDLQKPDHNAQGFEE